jgi:hypothetical protein
VEEKVEKKDCYIHAYIYLFMKVLHSQRINKTPLKPWIIIKYNGNIKSAYCDCVAGLGEVCSHVASILFLLENCGQCETSVTDTLAYWIGPKSKPG